MHIVAVIFLKIASAY